MVRNMVTGREEHVFDYKDAPPEPAIVDQTVSPDGRFLAGRRDRDVFVVSIPGGAVRKLFSAKAPIRAYSLEWAPDSGAVLLSAPDGAGRHEIWLVRLAGTPSRLDVGVEGVAPAGLSLHPGGSRLAFQTTVRRPSEIRLLEKVVPRAGGR